MIESKMQKLKKYCKNPQFIIAWLFLRLPIIFKFVPDATYLKIIFRKKLGYPLNLKNSKTFNEKIQWLKLYGMLEKYADLVDKYKVRKFIAEKIGEKYLIPLIGVWNSADEIDFEKLPKEFVLKCNHDCGSVIICKDKSNFDINFAKKKLANYLKRDFFILNREYIYKNICKKIIAEEYMGDNFDDYKIFTFNGKPDCIMVCTGRQTGNLRFYFFDLSWNLLRLNFWGKNAPENFTLPKPEKFDEMIRIAEVLSSGTCFLRVDLYQKDNQIYFGELTFLPSAGLDPNLLPSTDIMFGEKILLPFEEKIFAGEK